MKLVFRPNQMSYIIFLYIVSFLVFALCIVADILVLWKVRQTAMKLSVMNQTEQEADRKCQYRLMAIQFACINSLYILVNILSMIREFLRWSWVPFIFQLLVPIVFGSKFPIYLAVNATFRNELAVLFRIGPRNSNYSSVKISLPQRSTELISKTNV